MRRLRRATALLVSLLLAQLTLVGTEAQCGEHGAVAGRSAWESAAYMAMDMGSAVRSEARATSTGDCSGCEAPADHVPCELPWAPGAPCAQMASCAAAAMVVGPDSALGPTQRSAQVSDAAASPPPGPAAAPEPPPPRA